jgi:hypothetical protein
MRISIETGELFGAFVRREIVAPPARAVTAGVHAAGEGLQLELRQDVERAGLGSRIPNAIRLNKYPSSGASFGAAAQIWTKTGAARILASFAEGATIRGSDGKFLAIPTESVPRATGGGRGGRKRMTPVEVEAHFNQDLRMIPSRKRGIYLLVLDDVVEGKSRGRNRLRTASRRRLADGRKKITKVMFVLIKEARIGKRLSPEALVERWVGRIPDLIARAAPEAV